MLVHVLDLETLYDNFVKIFVIEFKLKLFLYGGIFRTHQTIFIEMNYFLSPIEILSREHDMISRAYDTISR